MHTLQVMVQRRFYTLLLLLLAGGFVVLLVELLWTGHTEGVQLVAVGASIAGLVLTGLGLVLSRSAGTALAVLLLLLSLTGLFGTLQHFEEGGEAVRALPELAADGARFESARYLSQENEEGEEGEEREQGEEGQEGEETPPPLAPLSLAGLSLMGAVILLGRQPETA